MAVTIHPEGAAPAETPSQKPSRAGSGLRQVKDSLGRSIGIRKIGPLERMRLFKAIGPQNSKNEQYLGIAMLAYSCAEIDGEPVSAPLSEVQMEALVTRLGDEGIDAAGRAQIEDLGVTEADIEASGGDFSRAIELAVQRTRTEATAAAKN